MKDLQWIYMLDVLSGSKFDNYNLHKMAELNVGKVIATKTYPKLTDRLYVPTKAEIFAKL